MKTPITRYEQLAKYRNIWTALTEWRANIPVYLDWTKPNSALSAHVYLKMQRPFLEAQFQCLKMKLSLSIAHLDPLLLVKFQSIWDVGDANAEAFHAGKQVLKIVEEYGIESSAYRFYHWEAVRATIALSQMLLRNDALGQRPVENLHEVSRQGIELSRKLIPKVLARVEDTIEKTLNE